EQKHGAPSVISNRHDVSFGACRRGDADASISPTPGRARRGQDGVVGPTSSRMSGDHSMPENRYWTPTRSEGGVRKGGEVLMDRCDGTRITSGRNRDFRWTRFRKGGDEHAGR